MLSIKNQPFRAIALCLAGLSLFSGISQAASEEDPWETFNRPVFLFNDTLDTWFLKPITQGYQSVTPQFMEEGVDNVFSNIGDVGNLANDLLQGKFHAAGVDTARLLVNTTAGFLGVFDVAQRMGLTRNDEDFGQTLGVWGIVSGPYVVLPLLGPSTPRDGLGLAVNRFTTAYPYMEHIPSRNTAYASDIVNNRAKLLKAENVILGDKYVFIRNAYLQNREFRVQDGQVKDDF